MNNEDEVNVKQNENINLNLYLTDNDNDNESLEEINLYFEHFRIETLCHYLNSKKLNSASNLTLTDSDNSSPNSGSYCNQSRKRANSATSSTDHKIKNTRKQLNTDKNCQTKKVLEHFSEKTINNNYSQINEQDSKLRQIFTPKLPYRFSTTTNDLHSLLKKLSCLKRVYSAVDINHNPTTNHFNHRSRLQSAKQNGQRKPLTKSDIVHLQQFKIDQAQLPNTTTNNTIQPVNVPKLCIEVQY